MSHLCISLWATAASMVATLLDASSTLSPRKIETTHSDGLLVQLRQHTVAIEYAAAIEATSSAGADAAQWVKDKG